ncbi:MAG: TIM barrel protein [Planctomycetaceae bacterium]|jgi:hexulose-6-phosphate isomerase|nr:TIM barrel protein [Planctomycetaceae bacterium]
MISRREFLRAGAVGAASVYGLGAVVSWADEVAPVYKNRIYKSYLVATPTDELCVSLKELGYDGIEVTKWNISIDEAHAIRATVEKHGLRVSSVMRGWASFNEPDKRDATLEETKKSLRVAAALGADTVLLVPCRIGGSMPQPWEFDIDFDPKTLRIKTLGDFDNAKFADYIKAHDNATESSITAVEELIPVAAYEGVRIGLENVWNNLWVTPSFYAAFVASFNNPWVGAYFDLGNHIRYARVEEYLKLLSTNVLKLHIKGYNVTDVQNKLGGGKGDWCEVDKASADWKLVRKMLDEVTHFNGYVAVEEGRYDLKKYSNFLDDFIGKNK